MATCNTISCGICDAKHVTTDAGSWCPECEEGFCSQCLKHHNVSKYTKSHEVISIENYQKLPPDISKIVHHCPEHEKRYQNYCTKHESLCCPLCISTNHRECVGLLAIDELIKSAKMSTITENLEQNLQELAVNIEKVINDREENLLSVTHQRQKYQDEIQLMRNRINDHLDKLERIIKEDLNTAEKKIKSETEDLLKQMKERTMEIRELQSNLTAVKTYASDLQTFLSTRAMQVEVVRQEKYMQLLSGDDRLNQISLNLKIDDEIANILPRITSFGCVSTTKSEPFTFKPEKDKQAQLLTAIKPVAQPSIEDIGLTLNKQIKIPNVSQPTKIIDFVISSKGKIIVADDNMFIRTKNRLLIFNFDGILEDEVPLSYRLADVTIIDDNRVAVSTGDDNAFLVINTERKAVEKKIATLTEYYGLTHREGQLFYIQYENGVHEIDLKSAEKSTIINDTTIKYFSRITTSDNKLYFTNNSTNTVTCCKVTGEILWQFCDESVLVDPFGIAVDSKLNVYVACHRRSNIVVISPDGRNGRRILGKENGVSYPSALYFDRVRNSLVVGNYNDEKHFLHVYNIIYDLFSTCV